MFKFKYSVLVIATAVMAFCFTSCEKLFDMPEVEGNTYSCQETLLELIGSMSAEHNNTYHISFTDGSHCTFQYHSIKTMYPSEYTTTFDTSIHCKYSRQWNTLKVEDLAAYFSTFVGMEGSKKFEVKDENTLKTTIYDSHSFSEGIESGTYGRDIFLTKE